MRLRCYPRRGFVLTAVICANRSPGEWRIQFLSWKEIAHSTMAEHFVRSTCTARIEPLIYTMFIGGNTCLIKCHAWWKANNCRFQILEQNVFCLDLKHPVFKLNTSQLFSIDFFSSICNENIIIIVQNQNKFSKAKQMILSYKLFRLERISLKVFIALNTFETKLALCHSTYVVCLNRNLYPFITPCNL